MRANVVSAQAQKHLLRHRICSAQAWNTNHIHRLVPAQAQCFVHNYVHVCAQAHYSRARHSIHRVFLHKHNVLFIIVFMFVRRHGVLERAILYIECFLYRLSVLFVLIAFSAQACATGHSHNGNHIANPIEFVLG